MDAGHATATAARRAAVPNSRAPADHLRPEAGSWPAFSGRVCLLALDDDRSRLVVVAASRGEQTEAGEGDEQDLHENPQIIASMGRILYGPFGL